MNRLFGKAHHYAALVAAFALIFSIFTAGLAPITANAGSIDCLRKTVTANETEHGGLQRLNVGGGTVQHVDYYATGLQSISYIVPAQEFTMIWWGYGSIYESGGPDCQGFDFVADAIGYATGDDGRGVMRLDDGHSGIVIDMRDGQMYNEGPLSDTEAAALIAAHKMAIEGDMDTNSDGLGDGSGEPTTCTNEIGGGDYGGITGCVPESLAGSTGNLGADRGNGGKDCAGTSMGDHPSTDGTAWVLTVEGLVTFDQYWSNWTGVDQTPHKVYLEAGSYTLKGGGQGTQYPAGCEEEAKAALGEGYLTIEDLRSAGLAE